MNRRRFLAGTGAAGAVAVGGGATTRLTNLRYYDPDGTVSSDRPPGERIFRAGRLLHVLDHRSVSRVTVLEDGTDATPYERSRYRHEWQPSRRRYRLGYSTFAVPPGNPPPAFGHVHALLHHHEATNDAHEGEAGDETGDGSGDESGDEGGALPTTTLSYLSPGVIVYDPTAETPTSPDEDLRVDSTDDRVTRSVGFGRTSGDDPRLFEFVLTPDAAWERIEEDEDGEGAGDANDGTVSFELSGRDEYAKVPPLPAGTVDVRPESRLRATLDRETGRLVELDDRRVVEQALSWEPGTPPGEREPRGDHGTRTFTYRIRTTFDQYGEATATMPGGPIPDPSISDRIREILTELTVY